MRVYNFTQLFCNFFAVYVDIKGLCLGENVVHYFDIWIQIILVPSLTFPLNVFSFMKELGFNYQAVCVQGRPRKLASCNQSSDVVVLLFFYLA